MDLCKQQLASSPPRVLAPHLPFASLFLLLYNSVSFTDTDTCTVRELLGVDVY